MGGGGVTRSSLRWCLPPDAISSLSVLCISVLIISFGGTIAFLFIRKTEQMWARHGEAVKRQQEDGKRNVMCVWAALPEARQ